MKKMLIGYALFFGLLFTLFFGGKLHLLSDSDQYKYKSENNVKYVAKTQGKTFYVYDRDQGFRETFVVGVNIGSAKPGYFPGDFGITKADYIRWFHWIGEMNANTIRVYVAQMPLFYQALAEYNHQAEHPLYVMHGVYLNEADIAATHDAFADDEKIAQSFYQDVRDIVDIIHGNANIQAKTGHAGGVYTADISEYVIGWILGIEWEAEFVDTTNRSNPDIHSYTGDFIQTPANTTPFEVMLAQAADTAIAYETYHYGEQRPVALSNWVTSDPLSHPGEPNPLVEDGVTVDMENILPTKRFEAGLFASYHVYPYYPDMFNYEQEYLKDGNKNTYQAYLNELNAYHSMPVVVAEFGIPAARGIAHVNLHSGLNQGHVTEEEQGEMLVSMLTDIQATGCAGALVFSWQDEWFKKTWNTMDFDIDERRPFWLDVQTNEQRFGLLSFDPGKKTSVCYVDGDISEWKREDRITGEGPVGLSVKSDEAYLYLLAEVESFDTERYWVAIDTIPGQGSRYYQGQDLGVEADFLLVIDGKDNTTVLVDPYYDTTYYNYGVAASVMPRNELYEQKGTGQFHPITLLLSRGIYAPQTGEAVPWESFDTGALRFGVANPALPGYDSIADFYTANGTQLEFRLPWLLLNVTDPSSGQIIGDMYQNGGIVPQAAGPVSFSILKAGPAGLSALDKAPIPSGTYEWPRWDMPTSHERLKSAYAILQAQLADIPRAEVRAFSPFEIFWHQWNETSFSSIASWFPIQPVLNYLIAFLSSVILYFFLVLVVIHVASTLKEKREQRIINGIQRAVKGPQQALPARKALKQAGLRSPFSFYGLTLLEAAMQRFSSEDIQRLRDWMLEAGLLKKASRTLKRHNQHHQMLLLKLLGDLGVNHFNSLIPGLMARHPKNLDFAYQGLLTLAQTGDAQRMAQLLLSSRTVPPLSFRSLQEILKAYSGPKQQLYEKLLRSEDALVRRLCVKRAGQEGLKKLAPSIMPMMDSGNFNMVLDAARTLGLLKYEKAGPRIEKLLAHQRWEVRSIGVEALSAIDVEKYKPALLRLIHDREWQVRSKAARALSHVRDTQAVLSAVTASGDRYALEILEYMLTARAIWEVQDA